jgi:hypothetical protein
MIEFYYELCLNLLVTCVVVVYCEAIEAWVFRKYKRSRSSHMPNCVQSNSRPNPGHKNITTALTEGNNSKNECDWLLRSPNTESYDIIQLAEGELCLIPLCSSLYLSLS